MVAIVSGNSLGLSLTSLSTLGQAGTSGSASQGRSGERAYVNIANGNLVLQDRDDLLVSHGMQMGALRTYDSQGVTNDDNSDNWSNGIYTKQLLRVGPINKAGSQLQRTDLDGAVSTYNYDATRNLYVTSAGAGADDTISFDAARNLLVWTDGSTGIQETYETTGLGRLMSISDTSGNTISFTYFPAGSNMPASMISRVDNSSGETTFYDYSASRSLTDVRTVCQTGDANAPTATLTRTHYAYDSSNRLSKVTLDLSPADGSTADGAVYETTYTYVGSSKNIASITQSDGSKQTFTYVTVGTSSRVASVTDALGQTTSFSYDTVNGRTTMTDPLGLRTVYQYDSQGQLTQVTGPAVNGVSQVISYTYNARGDVTRVVDGVGNAIDMQYDGNGNQVLQRDGAGNTVTRTYDARNQLLTETVYATPDPDGAGAQQPGAPLTTRYVYDGGNRNLLRFTVSAEGRVTEFRYNSFGDRVSTIQYSAANYNVAALATTDAPNEAQMQAWVAGIDRTQSLRTDVAYDFRGQLQSSTSYAHVDANGAGIADGSEVVSRLVYDQSGELLKTVSPNGATTVYTYDGMGRVLSATDATGAVSLNQYDDANNKTTVRLANGLATVSAFDRAGRLVSRTQTDAAANALGQTQYFYDADGRVLMTQDPTGLRNWMLYDAAGRKVADVDGNGSLTEYVYNQDNQVTEVIAYATAVNTSALVTAQGAPANPSLSTLRPGSSPQDQRNWRAYDAAGRLAKTVDAAGAVTETRYDGASRVVATVAYANAINTAALTGSPSPASIAPAASANDRVARNFYDNDGRLRATLDAEGCLTEVRYDAAGRQTQRIAYANATAASLRASGTLSQLLPAASADDIQTSYLYNGLGQLAGQVDGEGYLTENVYDANGNLTQSIRYANKAMASGGNNLAALRPGSSAQDQVSSWSYDVLNRVVQSIDIHGIRTLTHYDSVGNVTSTTVAAGTADVRTLTARYDLQGRLTGELSAQGSALLTGNETQAQVDALFAQYGTSYTYDAAGRRLSATDADGHRTLFFYDADGHLTHSINALGEVSERQYNALNQLTGTVRYGTRINLAGLSGGLVTPALLSAVGSIANSSIDSRTSISYNVDGTIASSTDALGNVTSHGYDVFGDEISRSTPVSAGNTVTTAMAYDRRGELVSLQQDVGGINAVQRTDYDAFGRVIRATDANGNVHSASYDRRGRTVLTADPMGGARSISYDAFDRVLVQTDATGQATRYAYDDAARSLTVTTPEGIVMTTVRNAEGQLQSVTDGKGNVTSYSYDHDGNLVQTTAPLNQESARYDAVGNLIETTDANGNRVAYTYDAANRLLSRSVDPAGLNLTTSYQYDAKGEQIAVTDPNGIVTQTTYDRQGRVASQVVDPGGLNLVTSYSYDARGEVLSVTSPGGTVVQYVYDNLGRRTEEHVDPVGLNLTTRYSYDQNGNVVSRTDANGNVVRYAYDGDDRLVYTVDSLGNVTQDSYDAEGRLTRTTAYAQAISLGGWGNAVPTAAIAARVAALPGQDRSNSRVYDHDGHLRFAVDGSGAVQQYIYDANGNVVERIDYANRIDMAEWDGRSAPAPVADAAHDAHARTAYDALNRAVYSLDASGAVTTLRYDAKGNVLERVAYANRIDPAQWNGQTGQLPVADAAHDMRQRAVYDAADRAIYSMDASGAVSESHYDGDGNLVERIAYANRIDPNTAATADAVATAAHAVADPARDAHVRQVYDKANRLLWSVNGQNAVTGNTYDRNGNLLTHTAYANAIAPGALPSSVVGSGADRTIAMAYDAANRMAYQVDAAGGVVQQVYDAVGNVVQRIAYAKQLPAGTGTSLAALQQAVQQDAANDRVSRTAYDAEGRAVLGVDAQGAVTEFQYDAFGAVVSTIAYASPIAAQDLAPGIPAAVIRARLTPDAAHDRHTSNVYDKGGELVYTVDALGYVKHMEYDGLGQLKTSTAYALAIPAGTAPTLAAMSAAVHGNGADQVQRFDYDNAGRLASSVDALGHSESYAYNGLGLKTAFTNKNGDTWHYDYDTAGRMIAETSPQVAMAVIAVGSNGAGDPTLSIDEGSSGNFSVVTRMEYDALGNLTARTEAAGRPEQRTTRYEYDTLGRQIKVTYPPVGVYNPAADNLAANGMNGAASRVEDPAVALYAQVFYNTLGDAVANRDVAGNMSYKAYDQLGRVAYDIDAEGYATGYQHNAFGDVTQFTRFAVRPPVGFAGLAPSASQVAAALQAVDHSADRVISSSYDRQGRLVQTTEPQTYVFDGVQGFNSGKTTRYVYDAFGQAVQSAVLQNPITNVWATSTAYYDQLGRQTASIDALGYLSTNAYDAEGNLVAHTEFANAAGNVSTADYTAPQASAEDRTTLYTYDSNNRKTSDIQVGVEYSDAPNATSTRGDIITSYGYDAVGNLTTTTDAMGGVTTSAYDALGRVTMVSAPAHLLADSGITTSPVTVFRRDAYGNVVARIDNAQGPSTPQSADRVSLTRFDSRGKAVQSQDANGNDSYASYDAQGNLAKQWQTVTGNDGASQTMFTQYRYDKLGNQTDVVTPVSNGQFISNSFDGQILTASWSKLVDPRGGAVQIDADYVVSELVEDDGKKPYRITYPASLSNELSAADAATGATLDIGSTLDEGTQQVHQVNSIRIYQKDANGNPVLLWRGILGAHGYVVSQDKAGVTEAQREYNAFGEVTHKGVDGGRQEYFDYDNAGHLWRTNSGDGVDKIALYDAAGNVTADIRSLGIDLKSVTNEEQAASLTGVRRVDTRRDLLGRTVTQVQAERNGVRPVISQTLDRWGNVLQVSDPRSAYITTTYRYNARNQVIDMHLSDAAGNQSADSPENQFYFDKLGRNVATRDANGNVNGQVYDADGNLVQERHADGGVANYGYDAFNQRVSTTDAMGNRTAMSYDKTGQLLRVDRPDDNHISYSYDQAGRQLSMTNGAGETTRYRYDLTGNVIDTTQPMGEQSWSIFNALGQKIGTVDANGRGMSWSRDYFGQLRSHTDLGGVTTTYSYDSATRQLLSVSSGRGQDLHYAYDDAGQLVEIRDGSLNQLTTYRYDLAGNRVFESTVQAGISYQNNVITYDAQNRITDVSAQDGINIHIDYDKAGNRLHQSVSSGEGTVRSQQMWYAYDSMNRQVLIDGAANNNVADNANLIAGQGHRVTYDLNGNRTSDTQMGQQIGLQVTDGLDESGNAVQVHQYRTQAGLVKQSYAYDGMNRLTVVDNQTFKVNNSTGAFELQPESAILDVRQYDGADRVVTTGLLQGLDQGLTQGYVDALKATGVGIGVTSRHNSYDADGRITHQTIYGTTAARQGAPVAVGVSIDGIISYDADTVAAVQGELLQNPGANAGNSNVISSIQQAEIDQLTAKAATLDAAAKTAAADADAAVAAAAAIPASQIKAKAAAVAKAAYLVKVADAAAAAAAKVDAELAAAKAGTGASAPILIFNGDALAQDAAVAAPADFHVQNEVNYDKFDSAGNVLQYSTSGDGLTSTYRYSQALFDGYKDGTIVGSRSDGGPGGTTFDHYDANGNLVGVNDNQNHSDNRTFINDADGMVLQKTQEGNVLHQLVVHGEVFGTYGQATDPDKPLNDDGSQNYINQDNFNLAYRRIDSNYPTATTGTYTVRQGDTLQSIAKDAYGDSRLWYLIADANGVTETPPAGLKLVLPNRVTGIHNDSGSFRPYDAGRVIGDTTPYLPAPASDGGGGCGGLGQILLIVVAIVVTVVTEGATSEELATLLAEDASEEAVAAAAASTEVTVAAGAVGAAAGSIASQLVGNALGIQDGFSWKAVALAAIGGAISGGLKGVNFGAGSATANAVVRGAVSNALTQGVALATGLQHDFNWMAVAASAAGAGVGEAVNESLLGALNQSTGLRAMNTDFSNALDNGTVARVAGGTLAGFASGMTTAVMRGGRINVVQVATDAFGNAIGDSIVDEMRISAQQEMALKQAQNRSEPDGYPGESAQSSSGLTAAQKDAMARGLGPMTDEAARKLLNSNLSPAQSFAMANGRGPLSEQAAADYLSKFQGAALAFSGLDSGYQIPRNARPSMISNAVLDSSSEEMAMMPVSNPISVSKVGAAFGVMDRNAIVGMIGDLANNYIENSSFFQTLRSRARVYNESTPWEQSLQVIGGGMTGGWDAGKGLVTSTVEGVGNLVKYSITSHEENLLLMSSVVGSLVQGDTAGAARTIQDRIEALQQSASDAVDTIQNLTSLASLLGNKQVRSSLVNIAQSAWDTAALPDKAYAVSAVAANLLAGFATGGESLAAKIATYSINAGMIGGMLPTSYESNDAGMLGVGYQQVAMRSSAASVLRAAGITADDTMAAVFALGRNLTAANNLATAVVSAAKAGITETQVLALGATKVMQAAAGAGVSERVGMLGAILHAHSEGMTLVDVVLQNASGHGVDLLFKNGEEAVRRTGGELFSVVEAKGGARTLSALEKDTNGMRQGGNDYNIDRLAQFVRENPNSAEAAQALMAGRTQQLGSYAYLGGADYFFKLNFKGAPSVSGMNKTLIPWRVPGRSI